MIVASNRRCWQAVERRNRIIAAAKGMTLLDHDAPWLRSLRRRLLTWFRKHARDLPWRRTRDPYPVWLSEIMLQQTQVATVVPYFERFIKSLPTIAKLAAAEEVQVLRLWEGLGYYRRARQLHRAAGVIVAEHGGKFPRDFAAVIKLPGIGRYTAGAILSIAFDLPAPILEANTVRLFSRLWRYEGDTSSSQGQALLWSAAEALLPRRRPGEINQALMELGSQVCLPRGPLCEDCPLVDLCPTYFERLQDRIPRLKLKPSVTAARHLLLAVRHKNKFLLRKAKEGERWAGLWDFPRFAMDDDHAVCENKALADTISQELGMRIAIGDKLATWRHTVTRYRITLECHAASVVRPGSIRAVTREQGWHKLEDIAELPLNTTGRKLHRLLVEHARK